MRHEQVQEAETMLIEAIDDDGADDEQRQRESDDDLAGNREEIGNMPRRLAVSTNMNSEKTMGKNFIPWVPAPSLSIVAMNS